MLYKVDTLEFLNIAANSAGKIIKSLSDKVGANEIASSITTPDHFLLINLKKLKVQNVHLKLLLFYV